MGEIHELFVLALSLVWFAGATPDSRDFRDNRKKPPKCGIARRSRPSGRGFRAFKDVGDAGGPKDPFRSDPFFHLI